MNPAGKGREGLVGGGRSEHRPDEELSLLRIESPQGDIRQVSLLASIDQKLEERAGPGQLVVPIAPREQHSAAATQQIASQNAQKIAGRLICPIEVLHCQHVWTLRCSRDQEVRGCGDKTQPLLLRTKGSRRTAVPHRGALGKSGEERRQGGAMAGDRLIESVFPPAHESIEDLDDRPVGDHGGLVAAAEEERDVVDLAPDAELPQQAGLAGAGLPSHQHQPAPLLLRLADTSPQRLHLAIPPHEAPGEDVGAADLGRVRIQLLAGELREGLQELAGGGETGRRLLLQAAQDDLLQPLRDRAVQRGRGEGRLFEVPADNRQGRVAPEGKPACDNLVENDAKRVEVRPGVDAPPTGHLRSEVADGALDPGASGGLGCIDQAEVHELGLRPLRALGRVARSGARTGVVDSSHTRLPG